MVALGGGLKLAVPERKRHYRSRDAQGSAYVDADQGESLPQAPPRPCTNCGAHFAGLWCPACGERRPEDSDYRFSSLFSEWLGTLTNADSRLRASLRDLLWRPGELSAAWFEGRRQRYLRIVQVFIFSTLYYLVYASLFSPAGLYTPLWGHTNPDLSPLHHGIANRWIQAWLAAEEGRDWDSLSTAFDQNVRLLSSTLVFLLAPLTALPMAVLLWKLKRSLVEHIVFGLHFWAFLIIIVTTLGFASEALIAIWQLLSRGQGDELEIFRHRLLIETLLIYLAMLWYSWFGLKRFYGLNVYWRIPWLAVMSLLGANALVAYRAILFFLAWFMAT